MNSQMGNLYVQSLTQSFNSGYGAYIKMTEILSCPGPSQAFVFCEENMSSMNDGYLQVDSNNGIFPDGLSNSGIARQGKSPGARSIEGRPRLGA